MFYDASERSYGRSGQRCGNPVIGLEKNKVNTLPHTPYSPDLAPCDFFLFPTLKKNLSGIKFDSVEEIREASAAALKQLPVEAFQQSF